MVARIFYFESVFVKICVLKYIQIESENEPISQIILSDIYGKRITIKKVNDHTIRIETIGIETGIYLIQIQLANGKLISKKIIIDN